MKGRKTAPYNLPLTPRLRDRFKEVAKSRGQTIAGMILVAVAKDAPELAEDIKREN